MSLDLDALRTEIAEYLEANAFVTFHGLSRLLDAMPIVYWDCERRPDFREFLAVAHQLEARLVVYHQREFTPEHLDEVLARLQEANDLPREKRRGMERRLREMRSYEGFTCALELSFEHHDSVYLFDLRTDWYKELSDIIEELDDHLPDDEEDDPGGMGGYFSRN